MTKNQTNQTPAPATNQPTSVPSEPVVKLATEPEAAVEAVAPSTPEAPVELPAVATPDVPTEPAAIPEVPVEPAAIPEVTPVEVPAAPVQPTIPVAPVQPVAPVAPVVANGVGANAVANIATKATSIGIGPIIAIVAVVAVLVGGILFTVISSSPKAVFKGAINKVYKMSNTALDSYENYLKEYDLTQNAVSVTADFALKSNIAELEEAGVNNLSLSLNSGVDYPNEIMSVGAELKGKKEKISLNAQYDKDTLYVKSSLLKEVIKIESELLSELGVDIDFETIKEEIKEYEKEYDTDPETYEYLVKTIKNALAKSIDSKYMTKNKEEIEVVDKEFKVTKYSYVFDEDAIQDLVEKVTEYLLEDDEFYKKLADVTGQEKSNIKAMLKSAKKSVKDIEVEDEVAINVYTKGLFNTIAGFGVEYDGKEYISIYTDGKNAEITFDNHEDDEYSAEKIVITIEEDGKGYKVEVKENKEKVLKIDVTELTEEVIDFKLTAYEEDEEIGTINVYLSIKQNKTTFTGEYKVKVESIDVDEYLEFSGKYTISIKEKIEKMSGTKNAVSIEEVDTDAITNKIEEITEKDEELGNIITGVTESIEEEMLDLNYIGMTEVTADKAETLLTNKKATVLYVGDTYYSYYYAEDAYDLLDNLETLQEELDFYSHYLDNYYVTSSLKELLTKEITNCPTEVPAVTPSTDENVPEVETPETPSEGESNTEAETPSEPVTNCVPGTLKYPAIYLIKDGKVQKVFVGKASYDDLKAALAEIGID